MDEKTNLPGSINSEQELDNFLSTPSSELVDSIVKTDGDVIVLGIAGKMGVTLGMSAIKAVRMAGVDKKIFGVSRFSVSGLEIQLQKAGIHTIRCDLLDRQSVSSLPKVKNVIFMAGRKFGTKENEELTWAVNTIVPANVAEHFSGSRIVVLSTGCVYPLVPPGPGCVETDAPSPVGEYAQSCLGRERVFQYYSKINSTPVCIIRLNYAAELRYGVLCDIAWKVWRGEAVDLSVGYFNAIWQGDANEWILRSIHLCKTPASILNITGPEVVSVKTVAGEFGRLMNRKVLFSNKQGDASYLNNSAKAVSLFGDPKVTLLKVIEWTAKWVMNGGSSLGKPTHFEVNTGKF